MPQNIRLIPFLCGLFIGPEQSLLLCSYFVLIAAIHTLYRFKKLMLYYGVILRRITIVTGPTFKIVVAQFLGTLNFPFEGSRVVLRSPGEAALEFFKTPIVQQFLLKENPSRSVILMHKLNTLFPCSSPEIRSASSIRTTSLLN